MNQIGLIALSLVCAWTTTAQGTIDFRNRVGALNSPVFDVGGGVLSTPNIVAELYWSPVGSGAFTVAKAIDGGASTPVSVSYSGPTAGYWISNGDRMVGVAPGVNVWLQVLVWDSIAGGFSDAPRTGEKY